MLLGAGNGSNGHGWALENHQIAFRAGQLNIGGQNDHALAVFRQCRGRLSLRDAEKQSYGLFYQFKKEYWGKGMASVAIQWLVDVMCKKI